MALNNVVEDTNPDLGGNLAYNSHSIIYNSPGYSFEHHEFCEGNIVSVIVHDNPSHGDALYCDSDGEYHKANASDDDIKYPCRAMFITDENLTPWQHQGTQKWYHWVLLHGKINQPNWNLDPGQTVYLSTISDGYITTNIQEMTGWYNKQAIGFAISPISIYFNPDYSYTLISGTGV